VRFVIALLALLALAVQARLWVGGDGIADLWRLEQAVAQQREQNERLVARNARLAAEVRDLRDGLDAVEARAREELGMAGEDETLYQFSD